MNDSGVTVFVANSHLFFMTALSWKPSPVLNHPTGSCMDFHHWLDEVPHWHFFSWPVQMHELINCGCGLMNSLVFSDDISIYGSLWKMSFWLTDSTTSYGKYVAVSVFCFFCRDPHCFAYLLHQSHMLYFAPATQQMLFSGKTNACTSLIDYAWFCAFRSLLSQPHLKPHPVYLLWISSYLLNDQHIKWYKYLI